MLKKLYIEPTTKCNLDCRMCFRHTWFDEPICDLSLEDFRRTLATMPRSVETIFFGGMGEPLFHKDILEMIRLAAETGAADQRHPPYGEDDLGHHGGGPYPALDLHR